MNDRSNQKEMNTSILVDDVTHYYCYFHYYWNLQQHILVISAFLADKPSHNLRRPLFASSQKSRGQTLINHDKMMFFPSSLKSGDNVPGPSHLQNDVIRHFKWFHIKNHLQRAMLE